METGFAGNYEEPGLRIRAAFLDHGEAVRAFALEERAHINVWRNKVEAMGFRSGRGFERSSRRRFVGHLTGVIGPPIRPRFSPWLSQNGDHENHRWGSGGGGDSEATVGEDAVRNVASIFF